METFPKYHLEDTPNLLLELKSEVSELKSLIIRLMGNNNDQTPMPNGYMSVKQAVPYFNQNEAWIRRACVACKIKGAKKQGRNWTIPKNAELI